MIVETLAARQDTDAEIWRERCAYAEGLGLCIGALKGVAVQVAPDLRTKINEVVRQAEKKEREATSLTKPSARAVGWMKASKRRTVITSLIQTAIHVVTAVKLFPK